MEEKIIKDGDVDLLELFKAFLRRKRWLLLGAILGGGIGLIPCFLLLPQWTTTSTFVSASKEFDKSALLSLAGLSGMGSGGGKEAYYGETVKSRQFLKPFVYQKWPGDGKDSLATIQQLFRLEFPNIAPKNFLADIEFQKEEACINMLKTAIEYESSSKTGIMTLQVTIPDPVSAYYIHLAILDSIQEFNNKTRAQKAKRERLFIEDQLEDFQARLEVAENRQASFGLRNISLHNPLLEKEALRLAREVQIQSGLVLEFRKQLELAKLNEEKEKDYIEVIEQPNIEMYKSKPRRKLFVAGGIFLGMMLAGAFVFLSIIRNQMKRT